jgi:hypothetical protein
MPFATKTIKVVCVVGPQMSKRSRRKSKAGLSHHDIGRFFAYTTSVYNLRTIMMAVLVYMVTSNTVAATATSSYC